MKMVLLFASCMTLAACTPSQEWKNRGPSRNARVDATGLFSGSEFANANSTMSVQQKFIQCGNDLAIFSIEDGKQAVRNFRENSLGDFKYKYSYITFDLHFDFLNGSGAVFKNSESRPFDSCRYKSENDKPGVDDYAIYFCFNQTAHVDAAILDGKKIDTEKTFLGLTMLECSIHNQLYDYLKRRKQFLNLNPNIPLINGNPASFEVEAKDLSAFFNIFADRLDFLAVNKFGENFIHFRTDVESIKLFLDSVPSDEIKGALVNSSDDKGRSPSVSAALVSLEKFLFLANLPETDRKLWKKQNLWFQISRLPTKESIKLIKALSSTDLSISNALVDWTDDTLKIWRELFNTLDQEAIFTVYESSLFDESFFRSLDEISVCKKLVPQVDHLAEASVDRILKNPKFGPACHAFAKEIKERVDRNLFNAKIWYADPHDAFDLERMMSVGVLEKGNELFIELSGFVRSEMPKSLDAIYAPIANSCRYGSFEFVTNGFFLQCNNESFIYDLNLHKIAQGPGYSPKIKSIQKVEIGCYNIQIEDPVLNRTVLIQNAYFPDWDGKYEKFSVKRVAGFFDGYTVVQQFSNPHQEIYLMPNTQCGKPESVLRINRGYLIQPRSMQSKILLNPITIDDSSIALKGAFAPHTMGTYLYGDYGQYALPYGFSTNGRDFFFMAPGASAIEKFRALGATTEAKGQLNLRLELLATCEIPPNFPNKESEDGFGGPKKIYLAQPTVGYDQDGVIQFATLIYTTLYSRDYYGNMRWEVISDSIYGYQSVCHPATGQRQIRLQACGSKGC